ncbi:MAG: hypothetical protein M1826_002172 [Phylliscum demangeonii]|nr:MAG: hypothetical protein M1826_002172 [Phylliscum demangeonii]
MLLEWILELYQAVTAHRSESDQPRAKARRNIDDLLQAYVQAWAGPVLRKIDRLRAELAATEAKLEERTRKTEERKTPLEVAAAKNVAASRVALPANLAKDMAAMNAAAMARIGLGLGKQLQQATLTAYQTVQDWFVEFLLREDIKLSPLFFPRQSQAASHR